MAGPSEIHYSAGDRYLRAALTGLAARQRAIAGNIANVDTPNFKASEVPFEGALLQALQRRGGSGLDSQAQLDTRMRQSQPTSGTATRADGNNVDVDREMIQLAETTLRFNALTQALSTRLAILRNVISNGQR